jgi:MFS family permease
MSSRFNGPSSRRWLTLALLGTAFFMVVLDSTIVYVALPRIDQDVGFSDSGLQWVMSAYLLSFGGLLLLGGRAADLLGRRRTFMVGVALFASASLLDAFLVALSVAILGAVLALALFGGRDATDERATDATHAVTPCPPMPASPIQALRGAAASNDG